MCHFFFNYEYVLKATSLNKYESHDIASLYQTYEQHIPKQTNIDENNIFQQQTNTFENLVNSY